jgi:hypothetical protein
MKSVQQDKKILYPIAKICYKLFETIKDKVERLTCKQ